MKLTATLLLAIFIFSDLAYSQDPTFERYNTSNFPIFDNCFELYVTPGVLENWGDENIANFINLVLNDDTTDNSDVFPFVWNYFNPNDLDSSQSGIKFTIYNSTYTKIKYHLYDPNDANCDGNPSFFCRGYGWYAGWNIFYSSIRIRYGTEVLPPDEPLVMGLLAHELQHLCNAVNQVYDNPWTDETKSELTRLLTGYKKVNIGVFDYNIAFDNPLPYFSQGPVFTSKYWHWYLWGAYLYEQFPGQTDSIYDDFWYQHVRRDSLTRTGMYSIAKLLEREEFQKYGLSGAELLKEVFSNWAVANFLDDTTIGDGKYGYKNIDIDNEIGFLQINYGDPDTLQNCGFTPALHLIDTSFVNNQHSYSIIYGRDSIFVYLYSADYIGLLADTSLNDGKSYQLDFQLQKDGIAPMPNIVLLAKAISFDEQGGVMSIEDLGNLPSGISTSIPDFGKDIKEVVLVISAMEDDITEGYYWVQNSRQPYNYSIELKEHTGVDDQEISPPKEVKLYQNYPNPFNSSTIISFYLDKEEEVEIRIYNILGQKVYSSNKILPSGRNQMEWTGKDNTGKNLPSGVYFYNLRTKQFSQTKKLILLR